MNWHFVNSFISSKTFLKKTELVISEKWAFRFGDCTLVFGSGWWQRCEQTQSVGQKVKEWRCNGG